MASPKTLSNEYAFVTRPVSVRLDINSSSDKTFCCYSDVVCHYYSLPHPLPAAAANLEVVAAAAAPAAADADTAA